MDYLRLQGDLGNGINIDDTAYTYAYVNKTMSTTNHRADGSGHCRRDHREATGHHRRWQSNFPSDIPGYTKQNAYRVLGQYLPRLRRFRFRLAYRPGPCRRVVGTFQATQRARFDFDVTQCFSAIVGCDPWHSQIYADSLQSGLEKAPLAFGGGYCRI